MRLSPSGESASRVRPAHGGVRNIPYGAERPQTGMASGLQERIKPMFADYYPAMVVVSMGAFAVTLLFVSIQDQFRKN